MCDRRRQSLVCLKVFVVGWASFGLEGSVKDSAVAFSLLLAFCVARTEQLEYVGAVHVGNANMRVFAQKWTEWLGY